MNEPRAVSALEPADSDRRLGDQLLQAMEQLSGQLDLSVPEMVAAVEPALARAYKRIYDPEGWVDAELDTARRALLLSRRYVDPAGREVLERLDTEGFARHAVQTARQAISRLLREGERNRVIAEAREHQGELVSGTIDRMQGDTCIIDLGKFQGVLTPAERIPGEHLVVGKPISVVLLEPRPSRGDAQVMVTRASQLFIRRLFEAEIPEVASGAVEIKAIAREPGVRTKVAVAATVSGLDPSGACIGPKGMRHRAILSELAGEHVDVVEWSEDLARFVGNALGPAQVIDVQLAPGSRHATVTVPSGQLSLAIGRDGQNARLAAHLTGCRIDIRGADEGG